MKKVIIGIFTLAVCFSAFSCGDKEEKDTKKDETSVSAPADEKKEDNKEDKKEDKKESSSSISEEDADALLKLVSSGELSYTGYGIVGDAPEWFDKETVSDHYKEEPPTISEDGVLTIDGEEYQLIPEEYSDDEKILSVEGSGFSLKDYKKKYEMASEDYEGLAAVEYQEMAYTINDEEYTDGEVVLYYSVAGETSYNVSLSFTIDD